MSIYLIIWLALFFIGRGAAIALHGKTVRCNFFYNWLAAGISLWLLYMAGVFVGVN